MPRRSPAAAAPASTSMNTAIIGLGITLIATIFGFGVRVGTLTEQVAAQGVQLRALTQEIKAINSHFVAYSLQHERLEGQR